MKTVIAITGPIGSGKSVSARVFEDAGIPVYDSDSRAKALYDTVPGLVGRLEALFGTQLRGSDGKLDRKKLSAVVFSDVRALSTLESVVHPLVKEDFIAWRDAQDAEIVAIESAIILQKPEFLSLADKVVYVCAPKYLRLDRARKRDGAGPEDRDSIQGEGSEKADWIILNDSDLDTLLERTSKVVSEIITSIAMNSKLERISAASAFVKEACGGFVPEVGIILGSGLGKLGDAIENPVAVSYKDIPGFPASTAIGHKGNFIFGTLAGRKVVAMQGRIHYYEGYPMDLVTLPVYVMIKLGIKYLFVSNAAGATNYHYTVGDLMIIKDHINLLPNPLIGPNIDEFGPRFPDMTRPYDPSLIRLAKKAAQQLDIHLQEGVYVATTGPSYETPAEYKFFRTIGADVVGMSTVPEVIVARHSDIPVFGISVVTDVAHDDYSDDYVTDGEAIVAAADAAADKMSLLFTQILRSL